MKVMLFPVWNVNCGWIERKIEFASETEERREMSNNTTNVSEKGEFVAETLRKLNLKLNAVKEASTKLLPFTTNEFTDMFTSIWE